MVSWFDIGAVLLAVLVGAGVYPAIAAAAGNPGAQKTVYLAHDIANLVEVMAFLPENANYLVPDSLNGTAELTKDRLIVQSESLRTPTINLPEYVSIDETNKRKVPIDFLYVTKSDNVVTLKSVKTASCPKVTHDSIMNSKLTISPLIRDSDDKDLVEPFTEFLKTVLEDRYNIKEGREGDIIIEIRKGPKERIIVSEGFSRKFSSLSCFIIEKTGLEVVYSNEAPDRIIIEITPQSFEYVLGAKIIEGIEAYHE